MIIAFMDFLPWDYQVESAYNEPLGGSQSAQCYLAEELARTHCVYLFNRTTRTCVSRGVRCDSLSNLNAALLSSFDVVIVLNSAHRGPDLRAHVRPDARIILWTMHAHNQRSMAELGQPAIANAFTDFVFVSEWQREQFIAKFGVERSRARVMRNAVAPAFLELMSSDASPFAVKAAPIRLAYTSTPFRGLELLLDCFPEIRAQTGAELEVYSSMSVYKTTESDDAAQFGHLYQRCTSLDGVRYVGSLPQPQLAKALQSVSVLAYPNQFAETSCIAVMEAMASSAYVVTSMLGALPETTNGFATLIADPEGGHSSAPSSGYRAQFTAAVIEAAQAFVVRSPALEQCLVEQRQFIRTECSWANRARQWLEWLPLTVN